MDVDTYVNVYVTSRGRDGDRDECSERECVRSRQGGENITKTEPGDGREAGSKEYWLVD